MCFEFYKYCIWCLWHLQISQSLKQPTQLRVSIISATLQLLIHWPVGIGHSIVKTTAIPLEVTMKSFGFDEELYRFPILDALVEIFE